MAFDALVAAQGMRLQLARVHDHVRDVLAAGTASGLIARSSYSVDDAGPSSMWYAERGQGRRPGY